MAATSRLPSTSCTNRQWRLDRRQVTRAPFAPPRRQAPDVGLLLAARAGCPGALTWRRPLPGGVVVRGRLRHLSVFDNLSRALALLGPDADTMQYEGQTHRLWQFQDAAKVAVSSRDDLISSLSVNIDADDPGDLRLWLPGGLLLGEATRADTVGAMRTLHREYGAQVGKVAPDAVGLDVGSIHRASRERCRRTS